MGKIMANVMPKNQRQSGRRYG
ncbi:MAG: hypothetical protein L6V93_09835 [Clostridiales bacterium]|nr:MAG: hypothetical protein L6V93_09835 [Clostridiales bacterium]